MPSLFHSFATRSAPAGCSGSFFGCSGCCPCPGCSPSLPCPVSKPLCNFQIITMNSEFKPLGIGKNIYIYAEVDIDKAFTDILGKSKKIRNFLDANKFDYEFTEKIRLYKNFRICFDSQIQNFIRKKELSADLRIIKKPVFSALEEFILERFRLYIQEQELHTLYDKKVNEVEEKFLARIKELSKTIEDT